MKLGLGLRLGGSGNALPRYVTDFANGFELPGNTYTGGPTVVADYQGTSVLSPADVLPIEGMRLATTIAEGAELGPELVVNGGFDTDTANWITFSGATQSVGDGSLKITRTTSSLFGTKQTIPCVIGNTYLLTFSLKKGTCTGYIKVDIGGIESSQYSNVEWETRTFSFVAVATAHNVQAYVVSSTNAGETAYFDNISVREVIPTWLPTDLSGDLIHASTPLRTTKGTVSKYAETYKGPLIEPARTNKVTCRKVNPVDTSNLTKAGDAAATLTVVDDAAALSAAGLERVCTSGKVYKLDNSLGTGDARVNVSGAIGSINPCFLSSYIRSDAATTSFVLRLSSGSSSDPALNITTSYTRAKKFYVEAGSTSSILQIWAAPGAVIYFILPQLEESLYCTPPIFKASDGTDPLTALTRPAANLTRPTAGTALESGNNFAIYGRVVPIGLHTSAVLFSTYTDANNYFNVGISNAVIQPNNRIGGVSNALNLSYVHAAGVPFEYLCYKHGGTMGISVRSWNGSAWSAWSAWATNADTQNAPIASTYQIGAQNNANHFAANYPFTEIIRLNPNLHPQTQLADLLAKGRI